MAKIQLVVEIDERLYKNIIDNDKDDEEFEAMDVAFCDAKPLPKGHGRIMDESKIEVCEWVDVLDEDYPKASTDAPTIIEADKEG